MAIEGQIAAEVVAIKLKAVVELLTEIAEAPRALLSTADLTDIDNAIMYLRHLDRHLTYAKETK